MSNTIRSLVEHLCGQPEFDEDLAFNGLENAIEYDFQKRLVRLVGALANESSCQAERMSEPQAREYFERKVAEWLNDGPEEIVRVLTLWATRPRNEEPRIEIDAAELEALQNEM